MTLLVGSVFVESVAQLAADAERAFAEGAEAAELRIDAYEGDPAAVAAYLQAHPERVWIVTCRSAEEGGGFRGDTAERVSRLLAVARGSDAYVDFEFADWRRSRNIQQKVMLAAARRDGRGHRLILSAHDFRGRPTDLPARVGGILREPGEVVAKVAFQGTDIGDGFAALDLLYEHKSRVVAICMGEGGAWTRVLAKKLGGFASYAALDAESPTGPGQLTLREMRERYRWDSLTSSTKVFGVIGDPVGHSMSPKLFNHWFSRAGLDAVYLPLRVGRDGDQVGRFLDGCRARAWLDVGGFSVTVPHKQGALKWVGEGADRLAQRIGAVNTLVFEGGTVRGFNTDCYAAVASLAAALGRSSVELAGMRVDVLGAGGSASAVVVGLLDLGCEVTVFARSPERVGFVVRPWSERGDARGEVLINCTPVGLFPNVDDTPMAAEFLGRYRLVFDLIYNPSQTRLLREAAAAGCATLNGLDMFVRQAAMQFELWTSRSADVLSARELLQPGCVVLIGMRGSGKTTVGRQLARMLGCEHVDLDEVMEKRAGRSIAEIFSADGEAEFRRLESEALGDVLRSRPGVLSVGGGAVLDPRNVEALRGAGTVVWLRAAAETLWERTCGDPATARTRPALTELGGLDEIRRLLVEREPLYRSLAPVTVDTANRLPAEIAVEIARRVAPLASGTGPSMRTG